MARDDRVARCEKLGDRPPAIATIGITFVSIPVAQSNLSRRGADDKESLAEQNGLLIPEHFMLTVPDPSHHGRVGDPGFFPKLASHGLLGRFLILDLATRCDPASPSGEPAGVADSPAVDFEQENPIPAIQHDHPDRVSRFSWLTPCRGDRCHRNQSFSLRWATPALRGRCPTTPVASSWYVGTGSQYSSLSWSGSIRL